MGGGPMSHGDKELRIINMARQHFCTADKYGFSIEDIQKMESILDSAVPNNESSKFPDFVFKGGFIEHFQVISSKETRKGAEHLKLKSGYNTKVTDIKSKIVSGEITDSASLDFKYPSHSYSDLKKSFLKKWKSHISSLRKYRVDCKTGIFFIQYSDFALEMMEDIYRDVKPGFQMPIREAQHHQDYSLSRDREMLSFIANYQDELKYVIFVNSTVVELISLNHIDDMLKLMPWDFLVVARPFTIETNRFTPIRLSDE